MAFQSVVVNAATDTLQDGFTKINSNFSKVSSISSGEGAALVGVQSSPALGGTNVQGVLQNHIVSNINTIHVSSTQRNLLDDIIANGTTAAEINYLTGVTPGIAEGGKALVVNAAQTHLDLSGIFLDNVTRIDIKNTGASGTNLYFESTAAPAEMQLYRINTNDLGEFNIRLVSSGLKSINAMQVFRKAGLGADELPICTQINFNTNLLTYRWKEVATMNDLGDINSLSAPISSISLNISNITPVISMLPQNSGSVRLYAFEDCFIEFGTSTVNISAHSIYMAAGTEVFGLPAGATHIAVRGVLNSGVINISGLDAVYKYILTSNTALVYGAGSSNVQLPSGGRVRLFSTTDCYIKFGDVTVSADSNSLFFEAGTEYIKVPTGATHIAAKRYTLDGGLYIGGIV